MYRKRSISVSVPAYNEEELIGNTLKDIPKFIDYIVVVNDGSQDNTLKQIKRYKKKDRRIYLIDSKHNKGIGSSVIKAHKKSIDLGSDFLIVMAGDNQMDPEYIKSLINECIKGDYDYVKANRFFHSNELKEMPQVRIIGNFIVTFLTKLCTGYWSISDPLNGYTLLKSETFMNLEVKNLKMRFDFEVSMLLALSFINARVKDVFIPARYGKEKSKIRIISDSVKTTITLLRGYYKRIIYKYIIFDSHPIALFLLSGLFLFVFGVTFGIYLLFYSIGPRTASSATVMISVIPFILGLQLILQSITLDMLNEPK